MDMPIVLSDDDGIRPAGKQDRCFYCNNKIGEQHKYNCVILRKKVKLRYCFDIEVEMPWYWDKELILFNRNDGSWCASNAIEELEKLSNDIGCLCSIFKAEFISMSNDLPYRKNKNDIIVPE